MWKALSSYFAGVNHYIKENVLPIEFQLLNYSPRPFSPIDAFAFIGYMGYSFAVSVNKDILFTKLSNELSNELFKDLQLETFSHPVKNKKKSEDKKI